MIFSQGNNPNLIWDSTKVPLSKEKQEMEIRKKEEPLTLITEWDKSRIKPLFKSFDKGSQLTNHGLCCLFPNLLLFVFFKKQR